MFEFIKNILKIFSSVKTVENVKSIEEDQFPNGLVASPTGFVASPIDYRDIPLSAVSIGINPTPDSYKIPYKLTVKDQGTKPICVACVGATIKEYLERKKGNVIEFDEDWLYAECKKIDGIPNTKGTYFRTVLAVMKNVGCMPKGGDPTDLETIAKHRIAGYAQITPITFENIRRAIYEYGAILMGFYGSNGGWQTIVIKAPKKGETIWGHATTGIGFEAVINDGQNSWSEQWGNCGLFQFLKDYLPFEAWSVVLDLPDNWQSLLPQPTDKPKYQFNNDLYIGLNNDEVKMLQNCLVYLGCLKKDDIQTGHGNFGNKTLSAVKLFQQRYGITQNGRVGPITRAKLNELFNN